MQGHSAINRYKWKHRSSNSRDKHFKLQPTHIQCYNSLHLLILFNEIYIQLYQITLVCLLRTIHLSNDRQVNNLNAEPVEIPTTSTARMENNEIVLDENESEQSDQEESLMITDLSLAESQTATSRLTRSGALKQNAAMRSRSNSLKKTIKGGKNPKRSKPI
jgi:hypothetical protein